MSNCDLFSLATKGVQALLPYQAGKPIDELKREYGVSDVIKLASNENPLGPSAKVLSAIKNELAELSRYPDGNAFSLKEALAKKHSVDVDQITIGYARARNYFFSTCVCCLSICYSSGGCESRGCSCKRLGT